MPCGGVIGTIWNQPEASGSGRTWHGAAPSCPHRAPHGWCCVLSGTCCSPWDRSSSAGEGGFSLQRVSLFLVAQAPTVASMVLVPVPVPPGCAEHAAAQLGWKIRNLPTPWPCASADAAGFAAWGGMNRPDKETHQKFKFHLKPISCCCGIPHRSH